jgi:hypothetical protein
MRKAAKELLARLAKTRSLAEARDIVGALETDHGFQWRAVGDREGNYGNINIGSDPGHAFVERVTNALDAVIERESLRRAPRAKTKREPSLPREAVEDWFNVPGGRVANLDIVSGKAKGKSKVTRQSLADNVVIKIFEGMAKKQPTLEVRDYGVGLTARLIPQTILSLNGTNKISKPYLAGAYGQGGSTALAFSPEGCLLVSRRHADLLDGDDDLVAVSFVRFNELDPRQNKNGRYEYLVEADNSVPAIEPEMLDFDAGTSVVHFHMDMPQYAARMTQLTGSLWWLLQNTMFDPVLPFWVEERRTSQLDAGQEADRRTIAGNYTRLMDDKKDKVEYHNSVDVNLSLRGGATTARVNYWVVKGQPDKPGEQSIAAYVDPYRPITFTFNGQTHGTEERRFTADRLGLAYLAKYLIIQVELDHLSAQARRELLSTTRDRLKQLSFYTDMREAICAALSEDERLHRLNEQRKEMLLSKHSEAEQQKMRERFARLMERFKAGADTAARSKGAEAPGRKVSQPGSRQELEPLATKDEPTFIKIVNTQKPVSIRLDRHALLRLESDAPDGYLSKHVHAKLTLACDPEGLIAMESRSDFLGGRARMTMRPTEKAKEGQSGTVTVFLFTPDEKQYTAKVGFKIEKPEEQQTSGTQSRGHVQAPTPIPVHKDEWPTYGWDENSVGEVKEDEKGTKIFVNMDNRHLVRLLQTGGYQETGIARMRNNFLLYVAFYAWAKHAAETKRDMPLEGKAYEEYVAREMDRVAQTVTHSISSSSWLEEE